VSVPHVVAVGALVVLVATACTGDDDESAPPTVPAVTVAGAATVPGGAIATVAPTTAAELDELTAGLLASDEVGLPASWTIRDLDPAIMDADMATLADPLQGLAACPEGAVRPATGWLQRTFSGVEPLDTGMLRVDLILAVEGTPAFAARQGALAGCTAGEESLLETATVPVAPLDGAPLAPVGPETEATMLTMAAGPTADVPYPSSYAVVSANQDGHTVTVVVGGVDLGVPFADTTRELVGRLLARL
jgi:hypothetical protein